MTTKSTTYFGMQTLFTPEEVIGNDPEQCGYYFVPYATFQQQHADAPASGYNTPAVSAIDIEWDDRSYLANKAAGFDYTPLEQSTKQQRKLRFDGPFDFEYDQHY